MQISHLTRNADEKKLTWFENYLKNILETLLVAQAQISTSGSTGGYFSFFKAMEKMSPQMLLLMFAGNFSKEKEAKYMFCSFEKAIRLNKNISKGHRTSRQSANPDEGE